MADDPFDRIRDAYDNPYHRGHCPEATHTRSGSNRPCGDRVTLEMRINDEQLIEEIWFQGTGCCLSLAAASLLVEATQGQSVPQVRTFDSTAMLTLVGASLTPGRQRCALLPWVVLQECLLEIESVRMPPV